VRELHGKFSCLGIGGSAPQEQKHLGYRHEIKDLFDRHDQFRDLSSKLRGIVLRELFVLGFQESQAEERSLGFCLRDVYKELGP